MNVQPHHKLYAAICLVFLSLAAVGLYFFIQAERSTIAFEDQAAEAVKQYAALPRDIIAQVSGLRTDVSSQLSASLKVIDSQIGAAITSVNQAEFDANERTKQALTLVDDAQKKLLAKDSGVLSIVDRTLNGDKGLATSIASLSLAYQKLPDQIAKEVGPTWKAASEEITCRRTLGDGTVVGYSGCIRQAIVGSLNETKGAMAEVQISAKMFPSIVSNVDGATKASVEMSQHGSKLLSNLATATTPLPKWVRIGLGIAPPLAGTASAVATTMVTLGLMR